jgi:hypothetical protein
MVQCRGAPAARQPQSRCQLAGEQEALDGVVFTDSWPRRDGTIGAIDSPQDRNAQKCLVCSFPASNGYWQCVVRRAVQCLRL